MRKLHIGGEIVKDGWETFNSQPGEGVDYVGDASNLRRFPDETFDVVYASHVLEHFTGFGVLGVLKEWYRVLKDDGELYVSVPDLDYMCELFLDKNIGLDYRTKIVKMIYGAHDNPSNFHYFGFDLPILIAVLEAAGFQEATKTPSFGIFNDSSELLIHDRILSINLIVRKHPKARKEPNAEGNRNLS